jgi:hypothetical protein
MANIAYIVDPRKIDLWSATIPSWTILEALHGSCTGSGGQAAVLLENGGEKLARHFPKWNYQAVAPATSAEDRQAHAAFPGDPDDPLA